MEIKLNDIQKGIWYEIANSEDKSIYNEGFYLNSSKQVDRKRFEEAFYSVLKKYPRLGIGFDLNVEGEVVPVTNKINYSIFEYLYSKTLVEAKQLAQRLVKDTYFDLKKGYLFRWFFIDCEESKQQLIVCVFHHIICDGASIQELVQNIYHEYCIDNYKVTITNTYSDKNYESSSKYWEEYLKNWNYKNNALQTEFLKGNVSTDAFKIRIEEITKIAEDHNVRRSAIYLSSIGGAIRNVFGIKEPLLGIPAAINESSINNIGQRSSLVFIVNRYNSDIHEDILQQSKDLLLGMVNSMPLSRIISVANIKTDNRFEANIPQIVVTIIPYSLRKLECFDWGVDSWEYLLGGDRYPILISIFEDEEFADINIQSHYTLEESNNINKTILNYMVSYIKNAGEYFKKIATCSFDNIKKYQEINVSNELPYSIRQSALEMYLKREENSICIEEDEEVYSTSFLNSAVAYYINTWEQADYKIVTVAIKEKRLWATVAAMIAAFISGRRFVILSDNEKLSERDQYIIENSSADILVSNTSYDYDIPYVIITKDFDNYNLKKTDEYSILTSDAYLVYTSGTTGKPKGVRIGPDTVMQLVKNTKKYLSNEKSRIYQFTEHTFDVFIQEVFYTILTGGALISESGVLNSELPKLPRILEMKKIDSLFLPYAALSALATSTKDAAKYLSKLDVIFVTGEQLIITPPIRKLFINCRVRLVNMYGPSETHVCSFFELPKSPSIWEKEPSIGKPAYGYDFLVISPSGLPVATGVPGELVVLGKNILNGYISKNENSVSNMNSSYRTGDMVVCNNEGYYSFLGRNDDQLKISGHRIHLGAIEAMLSEISGFPIVVSAVSQANKTIIIGHYEEGLSKYKKEELLELFRNKMPNYIAPKIMMQCKSFPKGRTGKIDRKSLLNRAKEYLEINKHISGIELNVDEYQFVKKIWEKVLSIPVNVGNKSLFDLGGTSLDALQIYGAISEKYDIDFSVLMKIPTIQNMSSVLKNKKQMESLDLEKYLNRFSIPSIVGSQKRKHEDLTLITGSTGFLGAHLLSSIISKGNKARVLVRGDNANHAKRRLKEKFDLYELDWNEDLIDVIPGDLTNDDDVAKFVSKPASRLIHAAAEINFIKSFEEIVDSNVKGTYKLLKSCSHMQIPLVYVSTTAVFPSNDTLKEVTESDKPGSSDNLLFGYPQSKWVADKLVEKFQSKGHDVYIVRAGRIGPSTKTGSMRMDDFFLLQLKTILKLNAIPNSFFNISEGIDLVPVDIIAEVISNQDYLMKHPVLHIVLNDRITWQEIIQILGIKDMVKRVNFNNWIKLLKEDSSAELNVIRTLIPLIESGKLAQASYPVRTNFGAELSEKFGVNHNKSLESLIELIKFKLKLEK
ncbi:SDR family oxidoreductase [Peptococcus simiae]